MSKQCYLLKAVKISGFFRKFMSISTWTTRFTFTFSSAIYTTHILSKRLLDNKYSLEEICLTFEKEGSLK